MVKTTTQCIPSAYKTWYRRALQRATTIPQADYAKKRLPFRYPITQGPKVSDAQLYVRSVFRDCVKCFEQQPISGGVTPPDVGPRNRSWWWNTATAAFPFYPHERRVLTWSGAVTCDQRRPGLDSIYRAAHEYLKINEQDFIDFYNDMKGLYGYPWSATNDPDEIAFKMWRIIAAEIEYSGISYIYVALTPGETAARGTGDCEDESILFFALMWKALDEIGKSLAWINAHLSVVYLDLGEIHHAYCWWLDKNDDTRIVECTAQTADLPADIYGADLWDVNDITYIFCRTDQVGEYLPYEIKSEAQSAMWYYNYFMQQSLNSFFGGTTPVWCRPYPERDAMVQWLYPYIKYGGYTQFRINGHTGHVFWTYLQYDTYLMPRNATRHLHAYCTYATQVYGTRYHTYVTKIYEVLEPWIESEITWGTKPALGNLLYTHSRQLDFGDPPANHLNDVGWFNFTIPKAGLQKYGICLVSQLETDTCWLKFWSREKADKLLRPYIAYN